MSTLTRNSPAGKLLLLLLFPLLLFLLLMARPPVTPPGSGGDPPTTSSSTPPPLPPGGRWGGERDYDRCPGKAIQHILCRHGSTSKHNTSKFFTNSKPEIRRLVKTALREGEFFRIEGGWKVVHTFKRNIGKSSKGQLTDQLEVILSEIGEILTAYPK